VLSAPAQAWDGERPGPARGEVAVLWVEQEISVRQLIGRLGQAESDRARGEVVIVLGPGRADWRADMAEHLPRVQVGVVDPLRSLGMYMAPTDSVRPSLLGAMAGSETAQHYGLLRRPAKGEIPTVLRPRLGPPGADPATTADPRARAEAIRVGSPDRALAYRADAQVLVRLAVAAVSDDPELLLQLAQDSEPLVRARAMDRVSDPTMLGRGAADASGVVRQVAVHRISALSVAGEWLGRERALEIAAASEDAALRWKAAWGLSVGGRRRAQFLTRLLQDVDQGVRREAARSLGRAGTTEAASTEATGQLTDPDPGHVLAVLDGLRRSGLATAEAVGPVLQHKDQGVRLGAAEALAGASDPGAHLLLRPLIRDRDERIRAAVVSVLPQLLADTEPSVLVLRAAARTGEVPRLARHPDLLVRWAMPGADADGAVYARGTIAREDGLRHARFSWNAPRDRPAEYSNLRPPLVRPYGRSSSD